MKEIIASVTERGQVTIPAEVRRVLGVKPREKVTFRIENGRVELLPSAFTLETACGSVPPLKRFIDLEEVFRIAKEEHAREVIREMNEG